MQNASADNIANVIAVRRPTIRNYTRSPHQKWIADFTYICAPGRRLVDERQA
jgi:hypothetical protein